MRVQIYVNSIAELGSTVTSCTVEEMDKRHKISINWYEIFHKYEKIENEKYLYRLNKEFGLKFSMLEYNDDSHLKRAWILCV